MNPNKLKLIQTAICCLALAVPGAYAGSQSHETDTSSASYEMKQDRHRAKGHSRPGDDTKTNTRDSDKTAQMKSQRNQEAQNQEKNRDFKVSGIEARVVESDNLGQAASLDNQWTVQDFLGSDIVDRNGETIGTISNASLNEDNTINHVYLSVGGVLGFGAEHVRIPFEKLERTETKDGESAFRLDVKQKNFQKELERITEKMDSEGETSLDDQSLAYDESDSADSDTASRTQRDALQNSENRYERNRQDSEERNDLAARLDKQNRNDMARTDRDNRVKSERQRDTDEANNQNQSIQKIWQSLMEEKSLVKELTDVQITEKQNVVILEGEVESNSTKTRIAEIARNVTDKSVNNEIEVKGS